MRRNNNRFGLWLVVVICLVVLGWVSSYGHGDKKHDDQASSDEKGETVETIDLGQALANVSIIQLKQTMDSIYAEIGTGYPAIESILKKSCFDCHSNKTNYPWYYKIPTIDAMIDSDIKEAREHLDLSNGFPFGGHADQLSTLKAIREQVEENDMPLLMYRFMHWGTTIDGATQDSLFEWIDKSIGQLETVYNSLGIPLTTHEDGEEEEEKEKEEEH